jgi:hypothetical protein
MIGATFDESLFVTMKLQGPSSKNVPNPALFMAANSGSLYGE